MTDTEDTCAPLLVERRGAVCLLTFNRPARLNAATAEMENLLLRACDNINGDNAIRVVVVSGATGDKPAFMAGGDIAEFTTLTSASEVRQLEQRSERVLAALEHLRVPLVGAIDGPVIGQGALIAACCDVLVAGPKVRFGFPIARTVGNVLSTHCLSRIVGLVGLPLARTMIMRAKLLGTDDLVRVGAVTDTVSSHGELAAAAWAVATEMAELAPLTLSLTKSSLTLLQTEHTDNFEDVCAAYLSHDAAEAQSAFFEKRTPQWRGC